jgi:eukaryotic translation initiation factor 2C
LQHELTAIRDACAKLEADYRPGITFIVIQKVNPNRVSSADKREMFWKFGSIPTRIMTDDRITHRSASYTQLFDFYMCPDRDTQVSVFNV